MILQYFFTLVSKALSAGSLVLVNIIIGRYFGFEIYNEFSELLILSIGLSLIIRFGYDNFILKTLFQRNDSRKLDLEKLTSVYFWVLVLTLLVGGGGYLVILSSELVDVGLWCYLLFAGAYSLTYINASCLRAIGRSVVAPFFEFGLISLFSVVVMVVLSYFGLSLFVADLFFIFGILASVSAVFFLKKYAYATSIKLDVSSFSFFYKERVNFFISSISVYFLQWVSPLIIIFFTTLDVGVYNSAYTISMIVAFPLLTMNGIIASRVSRSFIEKDIKGLCVVLRRSVLMALLVSLPVFSAIIIFTDEVIKSTFGLAFEGIADILILLSLAQLVNVAFGPVGLFLSMTNYEYIYRNIVLLVAALSLLLGAFIIPAFGLLGAAVLSLFFILLQNVLAAIFLYKKTNISVFNYEKTFVL